MVTNYAVKAFGVYQEKGARGLFAHSLRYVAFRIETFRFPLPWFKSTPSVALQFRHAGSLNEIGAVLARTIPDNVNPSIAIPLDSVDTSVFDRVAVIIHIFYPEITAEIAKHLGNIPVPYGLFITTDSEEKKATILDLLSRVDLSPVEIEIRIVPNRGRDVAPKYIAYREVYDRYPAFLHLHSKQSLHAAGEYASWRDYLVSSLIGSPEIAASNLSLLSRVNVGVVYPEHAEFIKSVINWGYDFPIARTLLARIGINLDAYSTLEFPSGSMYWGRSAAIKQLLNLNLDYQDFPDEAGQVDGTLAHAIERSLLYFVEKSGHTWIRVSTDKRAKSKIEPTNMTSLFESLATSSQEYITLTQQTNYETIRITAAPKYEGRRRLNLMVPSIESAHIFGGIDTALKIFRQIADASKDETDFRVVVSETPVSESIPHILQGYEIQKIGSETRKQHTIVDATVRLKNHLEVTKNDVFMATAWWTALNAYRLQEAQKILFGKAPKVIYLIQDFEPGFYGWSTKYALADSTYRRDDDTFAIFNSEELENFFAKQYSHSNKRILRYEINRKIDEALRPVPREKIILFYSRPSAVRNCFEAGIDGLGLWSRRNPLKAAEWQIYCIGEPFDVRQLVDLDNAIITGKMPLSVYAELLSKASVGLSLMISPHPSYPPLEMAYAGIHTITNLYDCKDLSKRSPLLESLQVVTPESIAIALEHAVDKAEKNIGIVGSIRCPIADIESATPEFSPALIWEHVEN
ncbi:rhamnan synthesis F family protein [Phyllobacterium zundukense]|uniref:Uncharacterized protein n=1 Tax=Phyllobacterium zundukense TaxID=1867719 RepID=A0ACD4CZA8_9HYPH|nr:rhamnan synthesis F family protein [Phyllobacterium zundukense]UXN58956.1 hypothetical protein N8E88_08635 [Phyllobacterium zundukense]